jgi:DNA helicase-2/ATP-dependent DNA helicase PcrA
MIIHADLQLHSKYSQAVSKSLTITELYRWGALKGIHLLATGDWTHPQWRKEIGETLEETGRGTLRIRNQTNSDVGKPEFLLATEISSIYSQGGKTRRVHNLVWVPSLEIADRVIAELQKRNCNLKSDGRPIVGISSKDLLALLLDIDERNMLIPAHCWTPWFALYGSKSGFDSIEECFENLAPYIYAIETGLSSDPAMNWRIKELDFRSIVSFSDAHSAPKIGREITAFEVEEVSYENIRLSVQNTHNEQRTPYNRIAYTVEFYPEEGKYHWDGHRKCEYRQTPAETREKGITCPACRRPLTVGVEYRIDQIAGRDPVIPVEKYDDHGVRWMHHPEGTRPPFVNMVPLQEIISAAVGVGVKSKRVQGIYTKLVESVGPEFQILLTASLDKVAHHTSPEIAYAIQQVRGGNVTVDPGYDGVFGGVSIPQQTQVPIDQQPLF